MNARKLSTPILLAATSLTLACGGRKNYDNTNTSTGTVDSTGVQTQQASTDTTAGHHSVLGGAVAGAAAGHVLGHHAIAGAAVGALIQHERNKHQATQR